LQQISPIRFLKVIVGPFYDPCAAGLSTSRYNEPATRVAMCVNSL
jgi:hypothetical protein